MKNMNRREAVIGDRDNNTLCPDSVCQERVKGKTGQGELCSSAGC